MTDENDSPTENGEPAPEPPRKRGGWRRVGRWVGGSVVALVVVLVLLLALGIGMIFYALTSEQGTRYVWQAATSLLGGKLTGTLDGGAIATGLRLRNVHWKDPSADVSVDSVSGKWELTREPWRFTVDYLHVGTVDVRIAPSPSKSAPFELPKDLRLPIQLSLNDLTLDKLRLHDGATTTEFTRLALHGKSDGRHHEASVVSLDTPFGAVTANLKLDGAARPFPLAGDANYSGKVSDEAVQVGARLSGSLENLTADVDASGLKLNGHAHVEAAPFADVPLKRAIVTVDHVNPQSFSPGAPFADLSVRAELQPDPGAAGALVVTGPVSIVNGKPGSIDQHLIPLIDAHANVRVDASMQTISDLNVRLLKEATVTGGGSLKGAAGHFDLKVAKLDLNAIQPTIRPTQFAGPIGIVLDGSTQTITLDLNDPKAALRAQGKVTLDAKQTAFDGVKLSVGKGRIELSGALKKDIHSSYDLKAKFIDFNPLLLTQQIVAKPVKGKPAPKPRTIDARVNGTLSAAGVLAPVLTTRAQFALGDSVYDNLPLTGSGTVQVAGTRILPSSAKLSVAGNNVDLDGSFGAPSDRLRFHIDAPQLERLGFGLAGLVKADGDVTGSFAHPNVSTDYQADGVVFGANRVGHAQGHAEARDGANGALVFTLQATDVSTTGVDLATVSANLKGTRANHTLEASAVGKVQGQAVNLNLAANGRLTDARDGTHWDGTVTRLSNKGTPNVNLDSPLTVSYAPDHVVLGATRLSAEGAVLDLKSFALDGHRISSAGQLTNLSVARLLEIRAELAGSPEPESRTDLIFDGDWDFALGATATGHIQLKRRSGDVSIDAARGVASLGITDIVARAEFTGGNQLNATLHAQANRIGVIDANARTTLQPRDGVLTVTDEAPLSGSVDANIPTLRTLGGLVGPTYLFDGRLGLKLSIAGVVAKPTLSGNLTGDALSVTVLDQGVQLKDGVIRIALSQNLVDLQQVEFHGASGTLRATGKVRLDQDQPDLTASIIADKLELFASPDRELQLSGSASIANAGLKGGIAINGKFTVDHALFDLPEKSAPSLGDDVVIVRPDGTVKGENQPVVASDKPESAFAPHADIAIDLGQKFRFRGAGADLGLAGTITATSAPNTPLRAVGNVRVTPGSTYTAFGRKLNIENGFFTFNGPVTNPGINILAMRRNQEIEAGVQVTGTVQSPNAKLISEPSVPDNEKLSWLLFGHGTDQGNNVGQQSAMTNALALLGSAGGKRIAQTFGFDEFSVGTSEVGLTDPQVVLISKAINERLVIGYEQGLQSASNAIKATINLSRFWSVAAYGGTFQGMDLLYTRRFDYWSKRNGAEGK